MADIIANNAWLIPSSLPIAQQESLQHFATNILIIEALDTPSHGVEILKVVFPFLKHGIFLDQRPQSKAGPV